MLVTYSLNFNGKMKNVIGKVQKEDETNYLVLFVNEGVTFCGYWPKKYAKTINA